MTDNTKGCDPVRSFGELQEEFNTVAGIRNIPRGKPNRDREMLTMLYGAAAAGNIHAVLGKIETYLFPAELP